MYAYIDGKLVFKSPSYVVIDAGGVGDASHVDVARVRVDVAGVGDDRRHCLELFE